MLEKHVKLQLSYLPPPFKDEEWNRLTIKTNENIE